MSLLTHLGKTNANNHNPETAVRATAAVEHASSVYPSSGLGRLVKPMVIAGTLAMAAFGMTSNAMAKDTSDTINSAGRIYRIFGNDRTTNKVIYEVERNVRQHEQEQRREAELQRRAQEKAAREQAQIARAEERASQSAVRDEIRARQQRINETKKLQKLEAQERELGLR
jgi:hypothetical protein